MATGRLGASDISATTWTPVYTCPVDTFTVATLSVCNRGASSALIRVALTTVAGATDPGTSEYLEYDVSLAAKGVLERTGIVLDSTNKYIKVYSNVSSVNAVIYGIETATA